MNPARMFLDYCPLPDKVIHANPAARGITFPISPDEPVELDLVFDLAPDGLPAIPKWEQVSMEADYFRYLVAGVWLERGYAWHEASRTLAVWPEHNLTHPANPG